MGSKSDYLENAILDHVLTNTALTSPSSVFIALFTTVPTDSTSGVEVTGGSYARLEVGAATGRDFTAAAAGATSNNEDWSFVQASANWNTVSGFAVMDSLTDGEMLYWGDVSPAKLVENGDTAKFLTGDLDITED